jgi:glycosyltransferase involved in cell wall biosynthesis
VAEPVPPGSRPGAAHGSLALRGEPTELAVVIPTQNRWDVLERTLEGLAAQTAAGFEVVVVVDKGAEPPASLAPVRVVQRRRRGVGAARNDGVGATQRPIVMFLGDDTIPDADLVARHLDVHRRHPQLEVGVLGAVHWHPEVAGGRLQRWLDWSGTQFDYRTITGELAGWGRLYSSNVSLKRAFFLDVGGFDEDFVFGYEDIELGLRLDAKGLRLLYEPAAAVRHLHRYRLADVERRFLLVGGGEYLMVRKHPEFPPFFLDRLVNRRRVTPWSLWPWLVDRVPLRFSSLRRAAEARADAWYSRRLGPSFAAGWLAAEELDHTAQWAAEGRYEELARGHLAELRWLGDVLPRVAPGARLLVAGCSPAIGRALAAAGYRLTVVVEDPARGEVVGRDFARHGLEVAVVSRGELETLAPVDAVVAFRIDCGPDWKVLLDAGDRLGALVAATGVGAGHPSAAWGPSVRGRRLALRRYQDGSWLVVHRGGEAPPTAPPPPPSALAVVEDYVKRTLPGRPWMPPRLSGAAR